MAKADDPSLAAAQAMARAHAVHRAPAAAAHATVALGDPAPGAQQQAQGVIGHVAGVEADRVGHRQAMGPAPRHVDAVIAGADAGDQAQARHFRQQVARQHHLAGVDDGLHLPARPFKKVQAIRIVPQAVHLVGALQQRLHRQQHLVRKNDVGLYDRVLRHWRRLRSRRAAEGLRRRSAGRSSPKDKLLFWRPGAST